MYQITPARSSRFWLSLAHTFLYTISINMISLYFQSIFSFASYHRLRTLGRWKTALFAFYLLLLGTLVFNLWFAVQLHDKLPVLINQFPSLTFDKGTLTAPDKPVTVKIPGTDFIAVFDAQAPNPPSRDEFLQKHIMAFVSGNKIYMISGSGLQSQVLPKQFSAQVGPQWLKKYESTIRNIFQTAAFFGSFLALGLYLLFSFCLAGSLIYLWAGFKRILLPAPVIVRWAVLLQGPSLTLWIVNLLWGVPLFLFGLFILFMIYIQQIFNFFPREQR